MMHAKRSCLLFVFFYLPLLVVTAQEYGYTRYDSKDGLAGSTVYCMTQDKDGFLWFGTESGLSRFDGTHFKNFTKADGLPDNEIIQLFADSKGRVWISAFKKTICYYYKGKIYNITNDTLLTSIRMYDQVLQFVEDANGNILMKETSRLHLLPSNGRAITIDKIGDKPIDYISIVARSETGNFLVAYEDRLFEYNNRRFVLRKMLDFSPVFYTHTALSFKGIVAWCKGNVLKSHAFETNNIHSWQMSDMPVNLNFLDDIQYGICTKDGAIIRNINNAGSDEHFLKGVPVSNLMKDSEGNIWFCTFGQGVYRLNSTSVFNLKLKDDNLPAQQVLSFAMYNQSILAGTETGRLYRLSAETGKPEKENILLPVKEKDPIIGICSLNGNRYIYATRDRLIKVSPGGKLLKLIVLVKAIFVDKDKLYVATNVHALSMDTANLSETGSIWRGRTTTVFASNDTMYVGTLNGLYCQFPDKSIEYLGEKNPELNTRITYIRKDSSGILWVGTYGDGIIAWKNGHIIKRIDQQNGLTSNFCRTMFLNGNGLWIGTDKGLNRIDISKPAYPVKKYTTGDGLASNIINAVYVEGSNVFVGTPEGVTFFDEQKIPSSSRCDLTFVDIGVGGQTYFPDEMPAVIAHAKNNVQFNYVGISYKSAGDIRYHYRLLGVDSNWKETRETFLSYPTLPSGDYELQVQAINKFDVPSKIITSRFIIEKLIWEKTWFLILVALFFLTGTGSLVWLIISRIRRREQEKTAINIRIGDLEQLARKAQMNPHFIFNSLNSIQQYVMDADIVGANKFISGFSRLIRQTLDFSSKAEITLEEELNYLSNYLDLERTRLENAFSWSVQVAEDVDSEEYYIPPMILQPFVENSVRHGLRYRKDNEGKVIICVKKTNNHLICVLEDNGIGRKAAMRFKSISPIEYQSKGLSLTAERIAMFNKNSIHEISMQIEDLEDDQHNALGTRVTISFPIL